MGGPKFSKQKANERGAALANAPTAIMQASFGSLNTDMPMLKLSFRDGTRLSIPTCRIEELHSFSAVELKKFTIEISPVRDALSFEEIDLQIYIPDLLSDLYGPQIFAETGRVGGKRSTPRKSAAARENGRKGGRPRKSVTSVKAQRSAYSKNGTS
jgi:hypothetical protein